MEGVGLAVFGLAFKDDGCQADAEFFAGWGFPNENGSVITFGVSAWSDDLDAAWIEDVIGFFENGGAGGGFELGERAIENLFLADGCLHDGFPIDAEFVGDGGCGDHAFVGSPEEAIIYGLVVSIKGYEIKGISSGLSVNQVVQEGRGGVGLFVLLVEIIKQGVEVLGLE